MLDMSVFDRTAAQAHSDGREFAEHAERESASEETFSDARFSPGEEPNRFRRAVAKAHPTTPLEAEIVEELREPLPLGFVSNAIFYSRPVRYLSGREREALYKLVKGGALEVVRTFNPDNYWLVAAAHTPNSGYYVWVMGRGDEPLAERHIGPFSLDTARTTARIAATEGVHDRAVSRGADPLTPSFRIVRRYQAGTGKRII